MGFVLVDLFLTVFIYLIFPVLYRVINGKVPKSHGRILALINSIICAIIFIIIRALISGGEASVGSFGPAFLYYFIAKSILVDKDLSEEDYERIQSDENLDPSKIKRCPKCNYQIFDGDETCQLCGNPLGKQKNKNQTKKVQQSKTKKKTKKN